MRRRFVPLVVACGFGLVLSACAGDDQAEPAAASGGAIIKGGDDRTGHYDPVEGWWKAAPDHDGEWSWGRCAESPWTTPTGSSS